MIFSQLIVLINWYVIYEICYKRLKNKQPPKKIGGLYSSPDGAVCLSSPEKALASARVFGKRVATAGNSS